MKVKDLIFALLKQDPEKEVMIQQGEEFDYMAVYTIKEMQLVDMIRMDDEELDVVVIEYS